MQTTQSPKAGERTHCLHEANEFGTLDNVTAKLRDSGQGVPAIHIDLHIHLPENKSRRDYEYIFEDIGKYILGNTQTPSADE